MINLYTVEGLCKLIKLPSLSNTIATNTASLPGRVVVSELVAERFSLDRLWRDN